jgi:hypothetical protein
MEGTAIISIHQLLYRRNDESTCVVAQASLDGDAFARGTDFYLVITRVAVVAVRHVGQGVLVARRWRKSLSKSNHCHTSKTAASNPCVCHTSETPGGAR